MTGLLERSDELTAIDAALRRALRGSGTFVLVDGPAGIGKTALLAEAIRRAEAAGVQVLHAAGGELERDFPFGVVRALLGPAADGEAPVALRAEAVPSGPAEGDQAGAIADVHRFVARHAAAAPLVLVVDDVHWADGASIHCLAYVARRLDGLPLALVAAGRESDEVRALRRGDGTVQLRPRPLSAEATSRLVLAAAPAADAAVCDACHVATGGTPLYVREIARGLEAHGLDAGADAARRVLTWSPEELTRMVGDRLAALPGEARALAQALAVLDAGASSHEVGALAGVDAEGRARAGDALRSIGVLAAGRTLAFAHPVLRAATAETLLPGAADRLHRRAADLLAEQGATAQRIAAQVMVCEPAADPQACERLLAAADDALARRAPETAMRHLRRALAEPPVGDAARGRVLAALGSAEALSFEQDAAVAHLEEAVDLAHDPLQRLDAALNLVSAIGMGSGNAAPTIRTLLAKLADFDDPALVAQVEAQLVLQGLLSADGRRATAELGARIVERVGGDTGASWAELAVAAIELTIAGTERERVIALARASLETDEGHPAVRATALVTTVRCLGAADALDLAEELIGPEPGADDPASAGYVHHYLGYFRADLRLRRGDLRTAERIATATWTAAVEHGWPMMRQAATGLLAELCVVSGDLARGERLVAEAECDEPADALTDHYTTLMLLGGRGRLRLAAGRTADGIADLRACGRALEARGEPNPALIGWRAPLAVALGGEEGRALAAEDLRLARRFGSPRAVAIALRAAAQLEGADADRATALLHDAATVLSTGEAGRYEHARVLADLGALDCAAGRTAEARDRLLEAYELAHRCGAGALEREVADGLRALGARPRRPFVRGPEALTVRERSVTELAASGASNREIADELVVTVRTVEFHLSRAFRKLGVASRTELDGALAAPRPPGGSGDGAA